MKTAKFIKKTFRWIKRKTHDPLSILREDVYSNDDLNRMVGAMHREQYKASQR
ncbi:MAG TPA: hypothetical protein VIK29_07135 [Paludibacter sp.]